VALDVLLQSPQASLSVSMGQERVRMDQIESDRGRLMDRQSVNLTHPGCARVGAARSTSGLSNSASLPGFDSPSPRR